jgi:hypothetical protein
VGLTAAIAGEMGVIGEIILPAVEGWWGDRDGEATERPDMLRLSADAVRGSGVAECSDGLGWNTFAYAESERDGEGDVGLA